MYKKSFNLNIYIAIYLSTLKSHFLKLPCTTFVFSLLFTFSYFYVSLPFLLNNCAWFNEINSDHDKLICGLKVDMFLDHRVKSLTEVLLISIASFL